MKSEQILKAVSLYQDILLKEGHVSLRETNGGTKEQHLHWMCCEVFNLVGEAKIEKAFRWLGFIQGALWVLGLRTIDEMRADNMSPGEEFKPRQESA